MNSGLFINNEFISLVLTKDNDSFAFKGLTGKDREYLYFSYNKSLDPPVELTPEAYSLYYPGSSDNLADTIKFIDTKDDTFKIFGKSFTRYKILDNVIQKIISENINASEVESINNKNLPFFLIVPPSISEKTKKKLVDSAKKKFKNVRLSSYVSPYINGLLNTNQLSSSGNVLFIDTGFSDVYYRALSISGSGKNFNIKTLQEDKIADTNIISLILRMLATELVESAKNMYDPSSKVNPKEKEAEVLNNIPVAQDILNELSRLNEWTSIETDIELTNGKGGAVIIFKDKLKEKLFNLIEKTGLDQKIQYLVKKHQPKAIVLFGENSNNPLLAFYFAKFNDCKIIQHQADSFKTISQFVLTDTEPVEQQKKVEEKVSTTSKKETKDRKPSKQKPLTDGKKSGSDKPKPKSKLWVKILVPALIIVGAFLVYQFVLKTDDKTSPQSKKEIVKEDKKKVTPTISNGVNLNKLEFSEKAGEAKTLKITSAAGWKIESLPGWLNADTLNGMGSGQLTFSAKTENTATEPKTATIKILFENNDSETIEIVQSGIAKVKEEKPEEIAEIKKTEPKKEIEKKENVVEKEFRKWEFADLSSYIESIRNTSKQINYDQLFIHIDPGCEVYYYIQGDKLSSQDIKTFLSGIKLGESATLVANSIKYNPEGKIIEFGQE